MRIRGSPKSMIKMNDIFNLLLKNVDMKITMLSITHRYSTKNNHNKVVLHKQLRGFKIKHHRCKTNKVSKKMITLVAVM